MKTRPNNSIFFLSYQPHSYSPPSIPTPSSVILWFDWLTYWLRCICTYIYNKSKPTIFTVKAINSKCPLKITNNNGNYYNDDNYDNDGTTWQTNILSALPKSGTYTTTNKWKHPTNDINGSLRLLKLTTSTTDEKCSCNYYKWVPTPLSQSASSPTTNCRHPRNTRTTGLRKLRTSFVGAANRNRRSGGLVTWKAVVRLSCSDCSVKLKE